MGFFDNLSKKASETYKNTAEKTNKLTREMKLKSLINDNKGKIEKIYIEIGKKVYEQHVREDVIDISNKIAEECSKIDAHCKEIESMQAELLGLKNLRLCKICASEISINAKFCPKCGSAQEKIQTDNIANIPVETNIISENNRTPETNTTSETNTELGANITSENNTTSKTNTELGANVTSENNATSESDTVLDSNIISKNDSDVDTKTIIENDIENSSDMNTQMIKAPVTEILVKEDGVVEINNNVQEDANHN